jgi:hypothetical protein
MNGRYGMFRLCLELVFGIEIHMYFNSKHNLNINQHTFRKAAFLSCTKHTDKRTDVWSRDFMIWKINFGLLAVAWAGLWNKRGWADYE